MVHRCRDQHLALLTLQAAARTVLLVLLFGLLGRYSAAAIYPAGRLWVMDKSKRVNYYDLHDVVDSRGPPELDSILAAASCSA